MNIVGLIFSIISYCLLAVFAVVGCIYNFTLHNSFCTILAGIVALMASALVILSIVAYGHCHKSNKLNSQSFTTLNEQEEPREC